MKEEYRENRIDFNIEVDESSDLYKVVHRFSLEQSRKLQGRKDTIQRQTNALEKIIINLLKGRVVYRITLQKKLTDKSTRYCGNIYKSKYRRSALEYLEFIGFCEYVLGSWKDKRETNVYPTTKLLSYFAQYGPTSYNNKIEETIIIKDVDYSTSFIGTKFKVLYEDSDHTNYLRDTLVTIRDSIRPLDISYPNYLKEENGSSSGSDINQDLFSYYEYHHSLPLIVGPLYKDYNFYCLYRVFNDDSLWSGGRIFGGPWINMKKTQRKGMTINGERCCIVDYSSMSIMQLDARDGRTIYGDYDNYAVPGLEGVGRTFIKKHIQRMINSDSMPKSFNSKDKSIAEGFKGVGFEYANNTIVKHLSRISHYFGAGIGKKLMNEESSILIIVLQKLIELNIPALPLHDAVITTEVNSEKVKEVMECVFDRFYQTNGSTAEIESL